MSSLPALFSLANDLGWIADCDRVFGDISCDNGPGPDKGVLADGYSGIYRAPCSDRREAFDPCFEQRPVTTTPRILVIGERDVGPDENAVFDRYSSRDKYERPDLTFIANRDTFFDVDEGIYLSVLADGAAVEVYVVVYTGAFPDLGFLDYRIFRVIALHFAGISVAEGIWTCIVRS